MSSWFKPPLALAVALLTLVSEGRAEDDLWGPAEQRTEERQADGFEWEPEVLDSDGLRNRFPGVEILETPPSWVLTPFFTTRIPLHALALGFSADFFPLAWLRSSATYSLGFGGGIDDEIALGHGGEAWIGLRLLHSASETLVELELDRTTILSRPTSAITARIPADYALFAEAGLVTNTAVLVRCLGSECPVVTDESELELDNTQIVMPAFGLRYIHLHAVRLKNPDAIRQARFQIYAHAFLEPFNPPPPGLLLWWNQEPAEYVSLGGRVGVDLPPLGQCKSGVKLFATCIQIGLAVAYYPVPKTPNFEFTLSYPFY